MATTPTQAAIRGGSFLIEDRSPDEVFIPEEFSDEQRQIGQTTREFIANEVMPQTEDLEQHKEGLTQSLLRKAGELGLLGGEIPEAYEGLGLDKISTTLIAEKIAGYGAPKSRRRNTSPSWPPESC